MPEPSRGEVWLADMNPVRGHEQAGRRPVLVISIDAFNHGNAGLAVVVPLTSVNKRNPLHVPIQPPEGGLAVSSYIKCEDIRSLSIEHLGRRWGIVEPATMRNVGSILRQLLGL